MWRWDIFCTVVDNYGDIGTCWRLAQQLAGEHEAKVRLWVDQLQGFAQLCPAVSAHADQQHVGRIEIRRWRSDFPQVEPANVVIGPSPANCPKATSRRWPGRPWRRSGSTWNTSVRKTGSRCHRLPSLRTRWPVTKYYFFPGFTPQTGGLLRQLVCRRSCRVRFGRRSGVLVQFGGPGPWRSRTARVAVLLSERILARLLQCWADGPVHVTGAGGAGTGCRSGGRVVGEPLLPGTPLRRSSLTAYALPFLPQASFDRLCGHAT